MMIQVAHRPVLTVTDWDNFVGLNMADWALAENPCIPTALVSDKYFPLLRGDPTLTAGQNRGTWSYDYLSGPPAALMAQAVKVTSWSTKTKVVMEDVVTMSDSGLEMDKTA